MGFNDELYVGYRQRRKTPCYQCVKRSQGCHAICPEYRTWREEIDATRRETLPKNDAEKLCNEVILNRIERGKKRMKKAVRKV